jgi:hypothetical protein
VIADGAERSRTVQVGESSSSAANDENHLVWKKIWKLDCHPRTKQFIWRVAHNSLAMKMKIKKKGMFLDTMSGVSAL